MLLKNRRTDVNFNHFRKANGEQSNNNKAKNKGDTQRERVSKRWLSKRIETYARRCLMLMDIIIYKENVIFSENAGKHTKKD